MVKSLANAIPSAAFFASASLAASTGSVYVRVSSSRIVTRYRCIVGSPSRDSVALASAGAESVRAAARTPPGSAPKAEEVLDLVYCGLKVRIVRAARHRLPDDAERLRGASRVNRGAHL